MFTPGIFAPPAPLCPVKFTIVKSNAHFTGVAPEDGTGVKFFEEKERSDFRLLTPDF
jgi:hypothetical protein